MLNKLVQLNYAQARYIVLKEFDLMGPIARCFIAPQERLAEEILGIGEDIDNRQIALAEFKKTGKWGTALESPMPSNYFNAIMRISTNLAHNVLCYSEYEWNDFISAWLEFCNEYVRILYMMADELEHHPECKGNADHLRKQASDVAKNLQGILNLVEIGMGYSQLIASTEKLLEKMETFKSDRPDIVRVSNAYLTSLGYHKKEE